MKAQSPEPVRLVCGVLAASPDVVESARASLETQFGPVDGTFGPVPFTFTDYYHAEMGAGLQRWFWSFEPLIDPGQLASIKCTTNRLEQALATTVDGICRRRINLDPGYITPAKLVLATTKDFAHRIYLGGGIFAEVTLAFRRNETVPQPWTYPDYRSGCYDSFLLGVRRTLPVAGH
ncbi:MAG: hypothetical protein A2340_11000 [Lentisphaerae bacterium RIFOXYB12_FULL_60_10]|nr:MAG: hypothetical protein A2340_11000 [Lentisphaerae bacterium RIFOXYB12_FULL_60_10]